MRQIIHKRGLRILRLIGVLGCSMLISMHIPLFDNVMALDNFTKSQKGLDGKKMLSLTAKQLGFGPRYLSAPGHEKVQAFLISKMKKYSHETIVQKWKHTSINGQTDNLVNIIGRFYPEKNRRIMIMAHYDSMRFAVNDPVDPGLPVPGANDSASSPAVLLELSKFFANTDDIPNIGIDIILFDGEQGEEDLTKVPRIPLGAVYFVQHLDEIYKDRKPESGLEIDMICDKDLKIFKEKSSLENAPGQMKLFWQVARGSYPEAFSADETVYIPADQHIINSAGIPTLLIIDFVYSYFHTTQDTLDKCSARSLEIVLLLLNQNYPFHISCSLLILFGAYFLNSDDSLKRMNIVQNNRYSTIAVEDYHDGNETRLLSINRGKSGLYSNDRKKNVALC